MRSTLRVVRLALVGLVASGSFLVCVSFTAKAESPPIGEAVGERLSIEPRLRASGIDVAVANGLARITGTVYARADELSPLAAVRATPGVRDVADDLEVALPPLSSAR
jgi:osmotically-inducible protein OsmY